MEDVLQAWLLKKAVIQQQEAITYEARCKLDDAFRSKKKANWKQWVSDALDKQVSMAQQANGTDLYKILCPKQMIGKST